MENKDIGIIFVICLSSMITGAALGITIYMGNCITPMDVYKGKTTLEYTVVDGVKVDSTVVWKEEQP
jgi:hypothetical protein